MSKLKTSKDGSREVMNLPEDQQKLDKNSPGKPHAGQVNKFLFSQLAQGSHEVLVEHEGQIYRLRLTRNGKLILNK